MYTRPAKILIIDDDVELVTLLVDYLTLEGFEVKPAHDGQTGLNILSREVFDLIILGLELGADDYVPKPCPPRELVARIRAILRRSKTSEFGRGPLVVGPLSIDMAQRTVTLSGQPVTLTGTELSLLEMLAHQVGQPVAKSEIYPRVLGRPIGRYDRAIDVHISSIRHKLAELNPDAISIESIRGVGYQLVVHTPAA